MERISNMKFKFLTYKQLLVSSALLLGVFCGTSPASAQSTSSVRSDGTILRNGQPFFPIGFYNLFNRDANGAITEKQSRLDALTIQADAGFNMMHAYVDGSDDSFFDEAQARNMAIFPENNSYLWVAQAYKHKPAVFMWSISDDSDNGLLTPEQIAARHQQVKNADPDHITYISLTGWSQTNRDGAGSYMNISDIVAQQSYPIGKTGGLIPANPLADNFRLLLNDTNLAAPYARPVIANIQSFSWHLASPDSPVTIPTLEEERNLTYGALAAGVKGIIWYSFRENSWYIPTDSPALWEELKSLSSDITLLQNVLLSGRISKDVNTTQSAVVASTWVYDNKVYIIACNTSYDYVQSGTIPLPADVTGEPINLIARLGADARDNRIGTEFSVYLAPKAVRVTSFDIQSSTPTPTIELAIFRSSNGLAADGSEDLLTPVNDGVTNLMKYAFNMIGAGAGQAATLNIPNVAGFNGTAGLPLVGKESVSGKLTLAYLRRKASGLPAPGITYSVQFGSTLADFAVNGAATEVSTSIDGTFENVVVTDSVLSSGKRFVRVQVSAP